MNQRTLDTKPADDLTPASAAKRDAIIKAAARVFMASGYGAASMDQIASEAGVSKQTVYSHFGAKDALFEAIIHGKCQALTGRDGVTSNRTEDPQIVLFNTASSFLRMVLAPESITLYRTILAECVRFPELASAFYRSGPRTACDRLAVYLESIHGQSELDFSNATASAELLFAMLRGDLYTRCLLALHDNTDEDEVTQHARDIVQAFLRQHRHI